MWTLGHPGRDGNRYVIAWFTAEDDALAALAGYNWLYSVQWDSTVRIASS